VHDQQPKRLRVHGAPHEEVEADPAQLIAQRLRVLIDDHHADGRILTGRALVDRRDG
jgi:hypothetical protein